MQYLVHDEQTGEVLAWIDTETQDAVVRKGLVVSSGEDLRVHEDYSDISVVTARFEKVSYEQFLKDTGYYNGKYVKKCYEDFPLPVRKTKGSAGYDFALPFDLTIKAGQTVKFATGVKCYISEGYVLELYPRSSLGFKYQLQLDNTVGIIDSDYYGNPDNEGHIQCKMTNHSDKDVELKAGDTFMQGIFKRYYTAEESVVTSERVGGIGSTSKKAGE